MTDVIIVGGFSAFKADQSFADESPILLFKDNLFCDTPGLYKKFVEPGLSWSLTDYDSPPYVCYVLKQLLNNNHLDSEMIFYLDQDTDRMERIFKLHHRAVFLSTTFLYTKNQIIDAARIIRKHSPETPIFCGGIFIDRSYAIFEKLKNGVVEYETCRKDYFFLEKPSSDDSLIDVYVTSDPDLVKASEAVKELKKGSGVNQLIDRFPNFATADNGSWNFSNRMEKNPPILPGMDWSLFRDDEMKTIVPMSRSKGCPFKCRYCEFRHISKYQEKTSEILDREITTLLKRHPKSSVIYFNDDNICGNKKAMHELTAMFIERKYPLEWHSMYDSTFIDDGIAEKLKEANCSLLKIGMESGDNTVLKNMNKPCRKNNYIRAVRALSKAGISIDAYFIVGFPGETEETIKNTIDTVNSYEMPVRSVNQLIFFPFILFPLTAVFEKEMRDYFGMSGYKQSWKHATMDYKKAKASISGIYREIKAMQPMHGNMEKIVVKRRDVLAQVDQTRGDLIRHRLKTGQEDPAHWAKLESLVKQLTLRKDAKSGLIEFV